MEDVCQSSPEDQVYTNVGVHLDILETSAKPTLMIAYLIRVYEVIVIADVLTLLAVIDRLNAMVICGFRLRVQWQSATPLLLPP